MLWEMGYGNDEGCCSGLGLGMRVAVGLGTTIGQASEMASNARVSHAVSWIEGREWAWEAREVAR